MTLDMAVAQTRLDALAHELGMTRKQREFADAVVADPMATGPLRNHPKVRRYVDEAIVQQRELAKAAGLEPMPTQSDVLRRMATRGRGAIWDHITFPDNADAYILQSGEVWLPGKSVLNLRDALSAGLGHCIKGMSIDKDGVQEVEISDSMAADLALGRYLGLEKIAPPVDDDSIKAGREALRQLLASDPEKARELESISIEVDRVRMTITKESR